MKCPKCNADVINGVKFCSNCGYSLGKEKNINFAEHNSSYNYSSSNKKLKSPGLAFFLGFLFGPLGLLYISTKLALGAFILLAFFALITGGIGLSLWFACAFGGYFAAKDYNKKH